MQYSFKQKKCLWCGKIFTPKKEKHLFCSRKCYMSSYRAHLKEDDFPTFVCPVCGKKTKLDFHPRVATVRWKNFTCSCGYNQTKNIRTLYD